MDKKADIVAFIVSENRINHFEIEQVNRTTSEHWKLLLLADSNKELRECQECCVKKETSSA